MDSEAIKLSLTPLLDNINSIIKNIPGTTSKGSLRPSYPQRLLDLSAEIESLGTSLSALRETCDYNNDLLSSHVGISADHAHAIQECISSLGDTLRELAGYTRMLDGGLPEHPFMRRLGNTLRLREEKPTIIKSRERICVHHRSVEVILCLLNLWLDIEQVATPRVLGHSLAALQKHISFLETAIRDFNPGATPDVQRLTTTSRTLSATAQSIAASVSTSHPPASRIALTNPPTLHPTSRSMLWWSILGSDFEKVRTLLSQGVNPMAFAPLRVPPLNYASITGNAAITRLLLQNGADVLATDRRGETALISACAFSASGITSLQKGVVVKDSSLVGHHEEVVNLLLDHGARHSPSSKGYMPIDGAVTNGLIGVLKIFLARGVDVNSRSCEERTPLAWAAGAGQLDAVDVLVQHGANINVQDAHGQTPLFLAATNNHIDCVKRLLRAKADHSIGNVNNVTPLHTAAIKGFTGIAELLLQYGADLHISSTEQVTALASAAVGNHVDIATLLLDNGADLHAQDSQGWTPVSSAAGRGHTEMVEFLLVRGADLNITNNSGLTPVHIAASFGKAAMVDLLLRKGLDPSAAACGIGLTPLYAACSSGWPEVVRVLLDAGAKATEWSGGYSPLHAAAQAGNADVVRMLLLHGADAQAVDTNGKTALDTALEFGHKDLALLFPGSPVP